MTTDVLERTDEKTTTTDNDDPIYSHYYRKGDIARAIATGEKIKALCGYEYTPQLDGDAYPACETCVAIWETKK